MVKLDDSLFEGYNNGLEEWIVLVLLLSGRKATVDAHWEEGKYNKVKIK